MKRTYPELQNTIALYKLQNPSASIADLALKFNLTSDQIRYALNKASNIQFAEISPKAKKSAARAMASINDPVDTLMRQLNIAIQNLDVDPNIAPNARLDSLQKIVSIKNTLQKLELERHLKKTDAQIIAQIIRRFLPNASNTDVIKIYEAELEKFKLSQL